MFQLALTRQALRFARRLSLGPILLVAGSAPLAAQSARAPDLLGRPYAEAQRTIERGVQVRWLGSDPGFALVESPGTLNVVTWQWPLPGAPLGPQDTLTLVCSESVPVPSLIDMRASAARRLAGERGLRLVSSDDSREVTGTDDLKLVVEQLVPAGSVLRVGSSVPVIMLNPPRVATHSGFWLLAVGALGAIAGVSLALGLRR